MSFATHSGFSFLVKLLFICVAVSPAHSYHANSQFDPKRDSTDVLVEHCDDLVVVVLLSHCAFSHDLRSYVL